MSATHDPGDRSWRLAPLALGALLVGLGLSGYLDDSGALPHPPWLVAVAAIVIVSLAAAAHTVRRLVRDGR